MIIYGDTNEKISHNRIKWNIKGTTEVPTSETPGKIGDVLVITSNADLIKKLKYVATKGYTEELQDNSINVYEDFTQTKALVNSNKGFKLYLFANQQNVMVDGSVLIANVFFYDGLTNSWKQYNSAYKEALNVNSFTGANINVDTLWSVPTLTDSISEEGILPTIDRVQETDNLSVAAFTGSNIDVDTLWSAIATFTDSASIQNLTQDTEIIA